MKYAASRLAAVQPSASAMVSERARAMKAAGHDVIDLGLGEPDFDTPAAIIDAATQYLLEDALVAAVPGSACGLSPFFRLSTATSEAMLDEAMTRIATSVAHLNIHKHTEND